MKNHSTLWRLTGLILAVIFSGIMTFVFCYFFSHHFGWVSAKEKVWLWLLIMLLVSMLLMLLNFGMLALRKGVRFAEPDNSINPQTQDTSSQSALQTPLPHLIAHLNQRYRMWWRYKVRLLMVVGDEGEVNRLVPGLVEAQWLEGERTVLIYGGELAETMDKALASALRALRRTRPLDGMVRVLGAEQPLTESLSDHDIRALEAWGTALGSQPPVWLWQLCHSDWSQAERPVQPVGITFPRQRAPQYVAARLQALTADLRIQGMAQVLEHTGHDFLLRLGQQLTEGASQQWQQRLSPWLSGSSRIWLRGLMFSLPQTVPAEAETSAPRPAHALILPQSWQGITAECQRLAVRRIGLPRERLLSSTIMLLACGWIAMMLLSFMVNQQQISTVARHLQTLTLSQTPADQLTALQTLRNDAGRLQSVLNNGTGWYQRAGLNHSAALLKVLLPRYGEASHRLLRDPAEQALRETLTALVALPADSPARASGAKAGHEQLQAWLMMSRPDRADAEFYARIMQRVQPERAGIPVALWQSLSPDLWAFYMTLLPQQPHWSTEPAPALVSQVRQLLLQQAGQRQAETTLYNHLIARVRPHYADLTLDKLTGDTDARLLFSTRQVIPGVFSRQAWEGSIKQEIERAARQRREETDWVLSDEGQEMVAEISPDALKQRLTARYFTEFSDQWLRFLNSLRWREAKSIADVTDQLTLISDLRQSPLIALINTLAWQGQTGQQHATLPSSLMYQARELIQNKDAPAIAMGERQSAGPLDETFGPLLSLVGKNPQSDTLSADGSLSLQAWLTRITRVRLRLQQIAASPDPQSRMQVLAQTVFQGKSVDLTDTQEYGSLMAASLGEAWQGFGHSVFVQPLSQAWQAVLEPSAAGLNESWRRSVVAEWHTAFDGRYPFAEDKSEVSLPALADFIRRDSGQIDRFLSSRLGGLLTREGNQWVPEGGSEGLRFDPVFLAAVNRLSRLSAMLFADGSQGMEFELQALPAPQVSETQLTIDGQILRYFNQRVEWQPFRWPGETRRPGTMLSWTGINSGTRLYGDYPGSWGFIRWLKTGQLTRTDHSQWVMSFSTPDGRPLQWVLRTRQGNGPLALTELRGFTLPERIFITDGRG